MMGNIITHSLGCKVNFADTQAVAERLPATADAVEIVGTCCVTAEGEKQSRKEVRRALKRVGPGGRVFVTGCAVRLSPHSFAGMGANVVPVPGEPEEAAALIASRLGTQPTEDKPAMAKGAARRTRFFLKVQEGCANMCAYCVVPLVRGRPRSLPLAMLAREAAARVTAGYPELVVSGINVGAWSEGRMRLPDLLEALAATHGLLRLRLSSIEATDVTPELLQVMSGHRLIGRHLHLPLQSGDDGVLEAMGRRYRRQDFAAAVAQARKVLPGINLTTDVITGYPAEDEAAFEATMEFVAEMNFSKVHVFVYSPRPGTRAAALGDPVPAAEKKRRSGLLRGLSDRLGEVHCERKLGQVSEILWESPLPSGEQSGYSSDYTRFRVDGNAGAPMEHVLALAVTPGGIEGRLVDAD
jgi:threonylcarbamoyladenosine tRNA methylthiotransferase MtaB